MLLFGNGRALAKNLKGVKIGLLAIPGVLKICLSCQQYYMRYSIRWDTKFVDKRQAPFPVYVRCNIHCYSNKKAPAGLAEAHLYCENSRYYLAVSKRFVTSAQFTTFQNAAI